MNPLSGEEHPESSLRNFDDLACLFIYLIRIITCITMPQHALQGAYKIGVWGTSQRGLLNKPARALLAAHTACARESRTPTGRQKCYGGCGFDCCRLGHGFVRQR